MMYNGMPVSIDYELLWKMYTSGDGKALVWEAYRMEGGYIGEGFTLHNNSDGRYLRGVTRERFIAGCQEFKTKFVNPLISLTVPVFDELARAEQIHPDYPEDVIHRAAIIAEEAGEVVKAAIDVTYGGKDAENLEKELIQTAAMCFRMLKAMRKETH